MPIIKVDPREALEYVKNFDWSASDALTDEDIARQAADDPDTAPVPESENLAKDKTPRRAVRK